MVSISDMSIFRCCSEGISMSPIFSCTTWMCFQMKYSVTPMCHLTRRLNIHKKPSGWCFMIREIFDFSFLRTFPSTTETGFSHQLSCSSIWTTSDTLAEPVAITFHNSQHCWLGFDCENLQIVNISHSMWYNGLSHSIRVSSYGWHSYLTRFLVNLWGVWVATLI